MRKENNELQLYNSAYEACKDTKAIIIGTEWNEFRALDFLKIKESSKIETYSEDYGLVSGNIKIEVNDDVIIDNDVSTIELLNGINTITKDIENPITDEIILTTVQHQEGVICDTIFVLNDKFNISKLSFIKKNIIYNIDNPSISSVYCELYYDGEIIPLIDSETDLRTSRLYLEKNNKNE